MLPRLFDAFLFCDELDVLEIRLHELAPIVDHFLLIEAPCTFTGQPKPLVYQEHKERFKDFPILHCIVDDMPDVKDPWLREAHQRSKIRTFLGAWGARPTDRVIVADCDEIPSRKAVREGLIVLENRPDRRIAFQMRWYYYWLNAQNVKETGLCPRMGAVETLGMHPQESRRWSPQPEDIVIPNSGWHFGWLGSVEQAKKKIKSFSHHELNTPEILDEGYLSSCFGSGYLLHNRQKLTFVDVDSSYPTYVQDNREKFARYIHAP